MSLSPEQRLLYEQAYILGEALSTRRASDPLLGWEPTVAQKPFIEGLLKGEKPENWFMAANRSGKSDAGARCGAELARFGCQNPTEVYQGDDLWVGDRATAGWVAGVDFPTLRDVLQPKYFDNGQVPPGATHGPFIPEREIKRWRSDEQTLNLKNGSIINFKSYDSGRTKFQGSERDWIHFDEEPPKGIYEESVIRVGGRMLRVFGTCTLLPPEGQLGGVSWIFPDIIQPWQDGKLPKVGIFTASIYSNPFIPRSEIERLESIYPEGSTQRRIRLEGELLPGVGGARAFPGFDRRIHVRENPPLLPYQPLIWCWDFNVEPFITSIGQRDGTVFRFYDELMLEEGNIGEMCELFYNRYPRHGAEVWIYGDATGKNRTAQTRKTSYQMILQYMQQYGTPTRLKVPESNPPVPDRINATNHSLKGPDGRINIQLDPKCEQLIADFEGVLLNQHGGIKKTTNKRDPYSRRTHAVDGATYWVAYEAPVALSDPNRRRRKEGKLRPPGYRFSEK